jgi:hypothetical protein
LLDVARFHIAINHYERSTGIKMADHLNTGGFSPISDEKPHDDDNNPIHSASAPENLT